MIRNLCEYKTILIAPIFESCIGINHLMVNLLKHAFESYSKPIRSSRGSFGDQKYFRE